MTRRMTTPEWEMQRMGGRKISGRTSVPPSSASEIGVHMTTAHNMSAHNLSGSQRMIANSEDLHAWSIYRQNLNSDFTDSALGSTDKSPLPYGNFQLRESTVQSILNNPKYGPRSELGTNMFTYLKFGLPRVLPPEKDQLGRDNSSGYDSTDEELGYRGRGLRAARSEDFLHRSAANNKPFQRGRETRLKSASEANLLGSDAYYEHNETRFNGRRPKSGRGGYINEALAEDDGGGSRILYQDREDRLDRARSQLSGVSKINIPGAVSYKHEAPMLNESYFPKDVFGSMAQLREMEGYKYPHLQIRNLHQ